MAFASWSPLWSGIVDSSLWCEADHVRIVYITMLALKDADHIVRSNAFQLARRSNKTEQEVMDALRVLSSPDSRRQEGQEFEGRRITAVEEGWLILNGEKYREKVSLEMKRARNRRAQAAWRQRQKSSQQYPTPSIPTGRERRYEEALERGDQPEADRIAAEGLPESTGKSAETIPPADEPEHFPELE